MTAWRSPPYSATGGGSFEICYCCGYEYGYTDDNDGISHAEWRRRWIDAGMPWDWGRGEDDRPDGWDPVKQLQRVEHLNPGDDRP